jgi:cell division protease FtsH
MHVPEEEKYLNSKAEIEAMLVGYMGGRAAEEIVFNSITTGASNDLEQATKLARAMVTQYGMTDKFGLMVLARQQDMYLSGRAVMDCGDATAADVDQEVMRILKAAYEEAKRLLSENREIMDQLAEYLIEKETITGKEFMEIFRRCKGIPESEKELTPAEKLEQETREEMEKKAQDNAADAAATEVPDSASSEETPSETGDTVSEDPHTNA